MGQNVVRHDGCQPSIAFPVTLLVCASSSSHHVRSCKKDCDSLMKKLNIPPYHVFSYRGAQLVCDVNTGRFMRVDEPTGAFLNCLSDGTDIAQSVDRLAGRYGREQCESIASEVNQLRAMGLLSTAVEAPDRRDYERQIARLVRMGTGNIELYLAEACNLRCKYC